MKLNWVKAGSLGVVALASLWLSTSAPAAVITLEQLHRLELGAAVQTWEIATSSGPRTPSAQPELPPWWHDEQARLLYLVWRGLPTDAAGNAGGVSFPGPGQGQLIQALGPAASFFFTLPIYRGIYCHPRVFRRDPHTVDLLRPS